MLYSDFKDRKARQQNLEKNIKSISNKNFEVKNKKSEQLIIQKVEKLVERAVKNVSEEPLFDIR